MDDSRRATDRTRALAGLAFVCLVLNGAILLLAPVVRPDLGVLRNSLSYYAVGPWAFLQNLAFGSMGLASLALAGAVSWRNPESSWQRVSGIALVVGGTASMALVVFPIDAAGPSTVLGDTHQTAGTIGGVALLLATLAMAMAARSDPRWSRLKIPALIALIFSVTGAMATQASIWWTDLGIPRGLTMRLVVVPLVLFWCLTAHHLRQMSNATSRLRAVVADEPSRH